MEQQQQNRGGFASNFGFLMAAVGSAVGLGNIWGFPFKMGKCGGFAFLIVYLCLAVFVGLCVMVGEMALGRKTGQGVVGCYKKLAAKYTWVGWCGIITGFCILCFYLVLGGYVTRYMPFPPGYYYADGAFTRYADPTAVAQYVGGDVDAVCKKIRELLILGIDKRLDADAPLGFLLSGGLDSSLVCAISAKVLGRHVRTFAIGMQPVKTGRPGQGGGGDVAENHVRPGQLLGRVAVGGAKENLGLGQQRVQRRLRFL